MTSPVEGNKIALPDSAEYSFRMEGIDVQDCYQCQKCSAAARSSLPWITNPIRSCRWSLLGMKERVLNCHTIWICASCYTCSTRCPNDIDIAGVMDRMRQAALREGLEPAEKDIPAFHAAFLNSIRTHGRVHELGLMARYKMKTGKFLDDFKLGWKMFTKGKLRLFPAGIKKKGEIKKFFKESKI